MWLVLQGKEWFKEWNGPQKITGFVPNSPWHVQQRGWADFHSAVVPCSVSKVCGDAVNYLQDTELVSSRADDKPCLGVVFICHCCWGFRLSEIMMGNTEGMV